MDVVTLKWVEVCQAACAGVARRIISIRKGLDKDNAIRNESDWATDIDGACAEMAVAKKLQMYWGGDVNTFKAPDVGNLHVRSTLHKEGHLLLRPRDNLTGIYVLVITDVPHYSIIGWLRASDGDVPKYYRGYNAATGGKEAWWIPQSDLHPLCSIPDEVRKDVT